MKTIDNRLLVDYLITKSAFEIRQLSIGGLSRNKEYFDKHYEILNTVVKDNIDSLLMPSIKKYVDGDAPEQYVIITGDDRKKSRAEYYNISEIGKTVKSYLYSLLELKFEDWFVTNNSTQTMMDDPRVRFFTANSKSNFKKITSEYYSILLTDIHNKTNSRILIKTILFLILVFIITFTIFFIVWPLLSKILRIQTKALSMFKHIPKGIINILYIMY